MQEQRSLVRLKFPKRYATHIGTRSACKQGVMKAKPRISRLCKLVFRAYKVQRMHDSELFFKCCVVHVDHGTPQISASY